MTGGDGLIGSAVVRLLAELGARVDVYDLGGPDAAARAIRAGAENHTSGSVADAEGVAEGGRRARRRRPPRRDRRP